MNKEELESAFNETTDNAVDLLKENVKLKKKIEALEKHNKKLNLEAQKYFDMLMECEYGVDKE